MWFSSDIVVICNSCNSRVVNLQQILQRQWTTWLWRHSQQWQEVSNVIAFSNLHAKLCFGRVLKHSLSAHLMQVQLLLFTVYVNGGLHAVSIGKPSERMSNFWTVQFFLNPNCILVFRTSLQFTILVTLNFTKLSLMIWTLISNWRGCWLCHAASVADAISLSLMFHHLF